MASSNTHENITHAPQERMDLLILGVTGSGKSSFCNFLVNEDVCKDYFGFDSCTQVASKHTTTFEGKELSIIDTAGFCDSEREDDTIYDELCKVGSLVDNGVDAIILMINLSERFSENQRNVMKQIEYLGGDIWNYTIIVFSRENEIKSIGKETSREYISTALNNERCPPLLNRWIENVNGRYLSVDSKEKTHENYRHEKLCEFLKLVEEIKLANCGSKYSNQVMDRGRKFYTEVQIANKEVERVSDLYHSLVYELESNQNRWETLRNQKEEKAKKQTRKIKFQGKITNIELQLQQHQMSQSFRKEMKASAERLQQLEIQTLKMQQKETV